MNATHARGLINAYLRDVSQIISEDDCVAARRQNEELREHATAAAVAHGDCRKAAAAALEAGPNQSECRLVASRIRNATL